MRRCSLLLIALVCAACADDSPTAPSRSTYTPPPPTPACERDHTGTITVINNGSRTADILWNGAVIATLGPGQTSTARTVTANGAQYVLDTVITNTNIHPCFTLVATPLQCVGNPYGTCHFN